MGSASQVRANPIENKESMSDVYWVEGLDPDANGLYDDSERVALLRALARISPAFQFDLDQDTEQGISWAAQSAGQHPLSMVIKADAVESSLEKVPWSPEIFPEWITAAIFQEDVEAGQVSAITSRGTIPIDAKQDEHELRPTSPGNRAGIEFAANSGQHLQLTGERYAQWNYRWCVLTFRIDGRGGRSDRTVLLDVNRGDKAMQSSPKIWFDRRSGLNLQYVGQNAEGLDQRIMSSREVIADGKTWNVLVCGTRYGQMYASLNGRTLSTDSRQPDRFAGPLLGNGTSTVLGEVDKGNQEWAMDALIFGLTEPSEAMVQKLSGWASHRLGVQKNLPADHPYRLQRPALDREDFPDRYVHDDTTWTAWGQSLTLANTGVNSGGERVEPIGFERVFYDDFRVDRISESFSGAGDLWMAPGFNTAVGIDAVLGSPKSDPSVYLHSPKQDKQLLALEKKNGRWLGSAFYSINDMGHGYTWKGPKIFRVRCMLPELKEDDIAGQFPAFWSYDTEFLFWRTSNRIELDWFEFEGHATDWINGIPSHIHYAHLKTPYPMKAERYKSYKAYGQHMTEAITRIPGGLTPWDGKFHTWEFVVDTDVTYANVSIYDSKGNEHWVELFRCPTPAIYLQNLDLQLDYALKAKEHGEPGSGKRQDFIIDWIEVLQKSGQVSSVPQPFTARPELTGSNKMGREVTCVPNLKGSQDLRYYWFADGYPLTWGVSNVYRVGREGAGKEIRCMVKAVGVLDQPEAWSGTLR